MSLSPRFLTLLLLAMVPFLVACGGGGSGAGSAPATTGSTTPSGDPDASLPSGADASVITHHQFTLNGQSLAYTAMAGTLVADDLATGAPEASIFYVAYSADGSDPAKRPITFLYNGGPGSSSLWLHLGSFGPKRLVTGEPSTSQPSPFPLVDNPECLLDTTDLVFVDPVGTGYSEAIAPHVNKSFWGVDSDAAVLRDFILRFLATNHRQGSPVYLFGESYGTPRTAVLANKLEAAGTTLTGIILQSSILDYNASGDMTGGSNATFFPSYAMVGAYYGLDRPTPTDSTAFAEQMSAFTDSTWAPALASFLGSHVSLGSSLPDQLSADSGIPSSTWRKYPNLSETGFRYYLISGSLLGRYDARVSAPLGSDLAADGDPSDTFIAVPFAQAMSSYLSSFLGFSNASEYVGTNDATIQQWDFTHSGRPLPDTIPDLASALVLNPHLKILSLNGYEDLATPFHQTELDLARLGSQPNLTIQRYHGGHLTYLDDTSRPMEKQDLVTFYGGTATHWKGTSAPKVQTFEPPAAPTTVQPVRLGHLRGPWIPAELRHSPSLPPTQGAALLDQVVRDLKARFDKADLTHTGYLTKESAQKGGFGFVAAHFNEIDSRHTGRITFQDLTTYLTGRNGNPSALR